MSSPSPSTNDNTVSPSGVKGSEACATSVATPQQEGGLKVYRTHDIAGFAEVLKERKPKNVIVMIGAGASVAAGIPDFRTPGVGLYSKLAKLYPELSERPEAIFSLGAFRKDPKLFYSVMSQMNMWPDEYKPTPVHAFVKLLADKKILRRCYTQNIDCLERAAGVDPELLVEAHGSFGSASCIDCRAPVDPKVLEECAKKGDIPTCAKCDGLVKPNVIFFGEALPERFFNLLGKDTQACDLLIVIGTSLQVQPFACIPDAVGPHVPRVLINLTVAGTDMFHFKGLARNGSLKVADDTTIDLFLPGDCQTTITTLVSLAFPEDEGKFVLQDKEDIPSSSKAAKTE